MTTQEIKNSKWQLSMIRGVCIGIEVVIQDGYSRVILNTILPDTDKEYKKDKKDIEGLMQYICDLHNNKTQQNEPR
jgi:hypothetical protein